MLKSFFNIIFTSLILFITFPLWIIIAVLIKITSNEKIFFTQTRLGKGGLPFKIYKFRTMQTGSDKNSNNLTLANDKRITKIGRILRKFKLDELPQLINVLKGEMNIVGPRPDVPEYYDLTNPLHQKVLSVKPGITGFAALEYSLSNKQNETKILAMTHSPEEVYRKEIFPQKMALNLKYIKNQSFWLDLKLIGQTTYYLFSKLFKN